MTLWWNRAQGLRARPRVMAILCGILLGFAQPPFGFLPGLFGYALLLWLLEGDLGPKPKRTAFLVGWIAGFFYFLIGCFWVAEAFLVFADTYGWMAPFAATLLPSGIALFWGAFALLYKWLAPKGMKRFLFFAALFSVFEILRGTVLTGFPWNPAGATWHAGGAMSQMAAYIGVYGLGFLTIAIFSSVAVIRRGEGWKGYVPAIGAFAVLLVCLVAGEVRLLTTRIAYTTYIVRVVQPAIGQKEKWSGHAFDELFDAYVSMTRAAPKLGRAPDLVVWPEGALPPPMEDLLADDSWTAPILATMLQDKQAFIMGVTRQDHDATGHAVWRNAMMAMHQVGSHAMIDGFYNKYKLVPFGEFTPFQMLARKVGFKPLTHFDDSFTPGEPTRPVSFAAIPRFLPLICYEGIFSALDPTDYRSSNDPARPRWILNISNDAWFGPTSGPVQHLNLASYRAIEEGLPMVRSTPTGISGLIDPLGRIIPATELGLGQRGYRDLTLPQAGGLTPFASCHNAFVIFVTIFCLILMTSDTLVLIIKKNGSRSDPSH